MVPASNNLLSRGKGAPKPLRQLHAVILVFFAWALQGSSQGGNVAQFGSRVLRRSRQSLWCECLSMRNAGTR